MPDPGTTATVKFVGALILLVASSRLTTAQALTYQSRDVTTPPPASFITIRPPYACTIRAYDSNTDSFVHQPASPDLTEDTFIKLSIGTDVNVTANVTGACDWYIFGNFYMTETRNLSQVFFYAYAPGNNTPNIARFYPNTNTQSMDTRVAGTTSGPLYWSASDIPGRHRLDFQTQALSTSCMIPNYSTIVGTHINAMACRPEWLLHPSGVNLHVSPGPITINVPPAVSAVRSIIVSAKTDWENLLGTSISVTDNAGCDPTDSRCVNVVANYGTLPDDRADACAAFVGSSAGAVTGQYLTPAQIRLRPSSLLPSAVAVNLQRAVAHELGHYHGLDERDHSSCSYTSTIMTGGPCDDSPAPAPNTFALGPTASDGEAITRSTRGNGNRKVCGWQ